MSVISRAKNAWNAFRGRADPVSINNYPMYMSSYENPSRIRISNVNSKSIVSSVYNQIAVDVSAADIHHVRLDDDDRFQEIIKSPLNRALSLDANIDQTGRAMIRDLAFSMMDEGVVAVVPISTSADPNLTKSYDIYELRVGKIVKWRPKQITVELYDEETGVKRQITLEKRICAIIENPFYTIMNEPNSVAQRLIRVLKQLDSVNETTSSGKLDLIIQLPYPVKNQKKQEFANERKHEIEAQLVNSKYGIAYIDGTEKVIQLNRAVENTLWQQAKDLQTQLYNQLGFSQSIFDGTADEKTLLNYNNRTVEPILSCIVEEMERKWISPTAITQKQGIRYLRNPFKLVPVNDIAEIADKFTRNEILSSNEIRSIIGFKPSDDPKADQLINANLNQIKEEVKKTEVKAEVEDST